MAFPLAEEGVRRSTTVPLRRLGVWLVVISFVAIQFVEVTIFTVGNFAVSLQKVVALVVFPVAFVLMRQIRLSLPLLIFAIVMILANSAAYVVESDLLNPLLLSANATVIGGFLGATVLYTALMQDEGGFDALGRAWAIFAAITSVLVLGQALGLLPLWTAASEAVDYRAVGVGGLYRGIGLKFDPNFQALMLVLGVVFAQFYLNRMRTVITLLIMLGIFGTFSRMGLLVAILAWAIIPTVRAWVSRGNWSAAFLKLLGKAVILAVVAVGFYVFSPQELQSYADERFDDALEAYDQLIAGTTPAALGPGTVGLGSGEVRVLLVRASLNVISHNYLLGVGGYRTPTFLYPIVGTESVAHNVYLEELLIGGLLGALGIALYITLLVRAMIWSSRAKEDADTRSFVVTMCFTFGLIGMFLTLNYNSILWLPLVLALAHSGIVHRDRSRV